MSATANQLVQGTGRAAADVIASLESVGKSYVKALNGVDFSVRRGEVVALLGSQWSDRSPAWSFRRDGA